MDGTGRAEEQILSFPVFTPARTSKESKAKVSSHVQNICKKLTIIVTSGNDTMILMDAILALSTNKNISAVEVEAKLIHLMSTIALSTKTSFGLLLSLSRLGSVASCALTTESIRPPRARTDTF